MITQCANAGCGAAFHYLRGGRLYRFDLRRPAEPCLDVPNAICAGKPAQASVYFWLCQECSRKYALWFSPGDGLSVTPLKHSAEQRDSVVARVADAGSI